MNQVYACVLAEVDTGMTFEAARYLAQKEAVGLVVPTTGPYDLMIIARADDPAALGKKIVSEFQEAPGVRSTLTLLILDELSPHNWMKELLASP